MVQDILHAREFLQRWPVISVAALHQGHIPAACSAHHLQSCRDLIKGCYRQRQGKYGRLVNSRAKQRYWTVCDQTRLAGEGSDELHLLKRFPRGRLVDVKLASRQAET